MLEFFFWGGGGGASAPPPPVPPPMKQSITSDHLFYRPSKLIWKFWKCPAVTWTDHTHDIHVHVYPIITWGKAPAPPLRSPLQSPPAPQSTLQHKHPSAFILCTFNQLVLGYFVPWKYWGGGEGELRGPRSLRNLAHISEEKDLSVIFLKNCIFY